MKLETSISLGAYRLMDRKNLASKPRLTVVTGAQHREPPPVVIDENAEQERAALAKHRARRRKAIPHPRVKVVDNCLKGFHVAPEVGTELMMEALGTTSPDFLDGLVTQIANVASHGPTFDERSINFALSMVSGIAPKDQVEAMLAAQMAAVHTATMTYARRLAHVETIPQQDSAEKTFNKLARTFAAQVEALKRYRSKGEQRVIVERVNVEKGGQAIVGNVAHGGGVDDESE